MPPTIAAHAEAALLHELASSWRRFNDDCFWRAMKPPTIGLGETGRQLGAWRRKERSITLSRAFVATRPWGVVLEVLKHEMAHQYTDEILGIWDESAHGPAFRDVCARAGVDASATGLPVVEGPQGPEARVLAKVQRLLALAESPNQHEAEAAMRAAHRLMLKHNIALAEARGVASYAFRQLGEIRKRFPAHEKVLAGLLGRHFFVQCVWVFAFDLEAGRSGRVLEIAGTPENLDIAEYVHGYLIETAERLWTHRPRGRHEHGTERGRFLSGVMVGFHEQLSKQARACAEEGLVWVGDADLDDYMGRRHPRLVSSRGPTLRATQAWQDGRNAGQKLVLHKPVTGTASRKGRLLEGK